jgi:CheY-like chemotaxis protein
MKKVALVDDDPSFGYVAELLFKRVDADVELEVFQRGTTFLTHILNREVPDIVFLDINMPDLNGWEILDQLQDLEQPPTLYMLSSSIDQHDVKRAKESDLVTEYLSKPLTLDLLKKILK